MAGMGLESMAWLTAGAALGWTVQWILHRRAVAGAVARTLTLAQLAQQQQQPAAPPADARGQPDARAADPMAADLAHLREEVARLAAAMDQRSDEARRLSNAVHLLDQQVTKLHLARSPVGLPRAVA